jgi:hypothetical protein
LGEFKPWRCGRNPRPFGIKVFDFRTDAWLRVQPTGSTPPAPRPPAALPKRSLGIGRDSRSFRRRPPAAVSPWCAHYFDQGEIHAYFPGDIADVEIWRNTTLTPTEIADLSGTPGYDLFPSDGTTYASASSATAYQWKTACADAGFYQGKLTIKEICSGSSTVTYGPGGYPNAVLTLQNDGNLVIYANAADAAAANAGALWAANTDTNPGDAMFLQPDGNLVIYGTYGNVLWQSGTDN